MKKEIEMSANYKAMPYSVTKHHEDVVDESGPWYNDTSDDYTETRYCIVSTETGEVLDDAQGYGYKTAQKAYAGYAYKIRDKSKDKERFAKNKRIKQWMSEHKSFVKTMNQFAFEIAKGSWGPDAKFDAKLVKKMLEEAGLQPDFTAIELLRVWQKC